MNLIGYTENPTPEEDILDWLNQFEGSTRAKANFDHHFILEPGQGVDQFDEEYSGSMKYTLRFEDQDYPSENVGRSVRINADWEEEFGIAVELPCTGEINSMLDRLNSADTPDIFHDYESPTVGVRSNVSRNQKHDPVRGLQEELLDQAVLYISEDQTKIALTYDDGWSANIVVKSAQSWGNVGGAEILDAITSTPIEVSNRDDLEAIL